MMHVLNLFISLCALCAYSLANEIPCALQFNIKKNSFIKDCPQLPVDAASRTADFWTQNATQKYVSRSVKEFAVLYLLKDKHDGYFVDLGAGHWDIDSATYVMEYHNNWKGICLEYDPIYLEGLLSNRKCTVISSPVGKSTGDSVAVKFHANDDTLSLPGDKQTVIDTIHFIERNITVTTLTSLLDYMKSPMLMDYLNLDMDGLEHTVLQGFNPSRYTFQFITTDRPKYKTHYLLSKYGYRFLYQISPVGECVYIHQTVSHIADMMARYIETEAHSSPAWHGVSKQYLLYPQWDQTHSGEPVDNKKTKL